MIRSSELRLGNYVECVSRYKEQHIFYKKVELVSSAESYYGSLPSSFCKPIPLTEELLLNCGFEKIENPLNWNYKMRIQALTLFVRCNAGHLYMEFGGIYLADMIKTVHHLQNFYHTFSNRELEINI